MAINGSSRSKMAEALLYTSPETECGVVSVGGGGGGPRFSLLPPPSSSRVSPFILLLMGITVTCLVGLLLFKYTDEVAAGPELVTDVVEEFAAAAAAAFEMVAAEAAEEALLSSGQENDGMLS